MQGRAETRLPHGLALLEALIVTTWCVAGMFLGTMLRETALPVGIGLVWMLLESTVHANSGTPGR